MDTETLIQVVLVIHVLTAILMAWPFYALVAVNNRARLGPPLGDRADALLEGTIRNRTVPCFVFQLTALVSGIVLVLLHDRGLDALVTNPALLLKFLGLLFIAGLLSYAAFVLQPQIDALFAGGSPPLPADVARQIGVLRLRRKRMAAQCLFVVLTVAMLGFQVGQAFPLWLTGVFVAAIALFAWRAYRGVTPWGWM